MNRDRGAAVTLRPLQPGDLGWIIGRHGTIYAQEYGFDISFEAVVAEALGTLVRKWDKTRDAGWIAERGGVALGSVLLVHDTDHTAKLRVLILDKAARGHGIGQLLAQTAVQFARDAGYHSVSLWTLSMLHAARAIYAALGFKLVSATPAHEFGVDLVHEIWTLNLAPPRPA